MKLLNLYSGTGSISKPWKEKGYEVFDVDVDSRFSPDYCGDILQWDYKKLHFVPDVIWASPPCDQYSRARTTGGPRNLRLADKLVAKAVEIINYFETLNPALIWFCENGATTLLWGREVAKTLTNNHVILDYCQYGTLYRKRTRIAHSPALHWEPRRLCDKNTCHAVVGGKHLQTAQQGPSKNCKTAEERKADSCSRDELHALPKQLTQEILEVCENHIWTLL